MSSKDMVTFLEFRKYNLANKTDGRESISRFPEELYFKIIKHSHIVMMQVFNNSHEIPNQMTRKTSSISQSKATMSKLKTAVSHRSPPHSGLHLLFCCIASSLSSQSAHSVALGSCICHPSSQQDIQADATAGAFLSINQLEIVVTQRNNKCHSQGCGG